MSVARVEAMVNMYPPSASYGKVFGIQLVFPDGHTRSFPPNDIRFIWQENLTRKQRAEVEQLIREIEG